MDGTRRLKNAGDFSLLCLLSERGFHPRPTSFFEYPSVLHDDPIHLPIVRRPARAKPREDGRLQFKFKALRNPAAGLLVAAKSEQPRQPFVGLPT